MEQPIPFSRHNPYYRYVTFDRPYGHLRKSQFPAVSPSDSGISFDMSSVTTLDSPVPASPASSIGKGQNNSGSKIKSKPQSLNLDSVHKHQKYLQALALAEMPVLSPTDKKLVDKISELQVYIDEFKDMEHPQGAKAPKKTVQKLNEAVQSIKTERELLAIKHTGEKYRQLYNKALKEQAELEWRLRILDEDQGQKDMPETYLLEKQRLFQEYLDIVEQRNTLIELMDDLEKLQD